MPGCYGQPATKLVTINYSPGSRDNHTLALCKDCALRVAKDARRYGYEVRTHNPFWPDLGISVTTGLGLGAGWTAASAIVSDIMKKRRAAKTGKRKNPLLPPSFTDILKKGR
jgi:hypothetical protein